MSALTVVNLINAAPPAAAAAGGSIAFPVPAMLAWLVVGGLLMMACAVLALVSDRPPSQRSRTARPRGWVSAQPHAHRP